jgi:hypothetical protein
MDKLNIFKSNNFFMDAGDVLHILVKDLTGTGVTIGLNDGDGNEEDTEPIGFTTTLAPTTTAAPVVIEIVTTKVGELMITLDGSDDVYIDWGDGSAIELVNISDNEFYHTYVGGGTIQIYDAVGITQVVLSDNSITDVDIPAGCIYIEEIEVYSENIATVTTHAEWVNLFNFAIANIDPNIPILTGITLTTHAEWVSLRELYLASFDLSTVVTHSEWVAFQTLNFQTSNALTTVTVRPEWVALNSIYIKNTGLSDLEIPTECVNLLSVQLEDNAIVSDADINDILITLDTMAIPLTIVDLSGGTNAAPTGLGVTAKNNMIGRGIIVTTN